MYYLWHRPVPGPGGFLETRRFTNQLDRHILFVLIYIGNNKFLGNLALLLRFMAISSRYS